MKKIIIFLAIFGFFLIYFLGPGWHFFYSPKVVIKQNISVTSYKNFQSVQSINPIKPFNDSKLILISESQSEYSILYLHGFSASPAEISPCVELLADSLNANAFLPRLSLHGEQGGRFENLTADDLFNDAENSFKLASQIGKKVIVVGTSTGASLALWLASRHQDRIWLTIMLSPNLAVKDDRGFLLAGPLGRLVAKTILGPMYKWDARHASQEQFWTTEYQSESLRAMADVVALVSSLKIKNSSSSFLTFINPEDQVINSDKALDYIKKINSKFNEIVLVQTDEHVLAGKITAPQNVEFFHNTVLSYIKKINKNEN
jgi:esterase/lipase